jgi:hypothetical protein
MVMSSTREFIGAGFRAGAAYHPACELKSTTAKKAAAYHREQSEGPMQLAGIA